MTPFAAVTAAKLGRCWNGESRAVGKPAASSRSWTSAAERERCCSSCASRQPTWRLAGVDESAGHAGGRARPERTAPRIAWARAPLEGPLPFGPAFDACGCFYDTLNHLLDDAALDPGVRGRSRRCCTRAACWPSTSRTASASSGGGGTATSSRAAAGGWSSPRASTPRPGSATVDVTLTRGDQTADVPAHRTLFSPEEVAGALAAAGFEVRCADAWSPFDWDKTRQDVGSGDKEASENRFGGQREHCVIQVKSTSIFRTRRRESLDDWAIST